MGTQKSSMFDTPCDYMVPEDKETLDRALPSHWTSMLAYNSSAPTATPFLNQHAVDYKGSPDEDHDTTNDFPSAKKQRCNLMLENASSIKLNQDLETGLDATGTNAQLVKLIEIDELCERIETLDSEISMLEKWFKSLAKECLEHLAKL